MAATCRRASREHRRRQRRSTSPRRAPTSPPTSPIFTPPFLGSRVAKGISLDDIAAYINETALFRNQWQFRPDKALSENDDEFKARIRPTLRAQLDERQGRGMRSCPRSSWGYFPVNSEGNDLVVWTDDDRRTERLRFTFPRQRKDRFLCIADFFRLGRSRATPTTPRSTS